jgi:hypothetical protein
VWNEAIQDNTNAKDASAVQARSRFLSHLDLAHVWMVPQSTGSMGAPRSATTTRQQRHASRPAGVVDVNAGRRPSTELGSAPPPFRTGTGVPCALPGRWSPSDPCPVVVLGTRVASQRGTGPPGPGVPLRTGLRSRCGHQAAALPPRLPRVGAGAPTERASAGPDHKVCGRCGKKRNTNFGAVPPGLFG